MTLIDDTVAAGVEAEAIANNNPLNRHDRRALKHKRKHIEARIKKEDATERNKVIAGLVLKSSQGGAMHDHVQVGYMNNANICFLRLLDGTATPQDVNTLIVIALGISELSRNIKADKDTIQQWGQALQPALDALCDAYKTFKESDTTAATPECKQHVPGMLDLYRELMAMSSTKQLHIAFTAARKRLSKRVVTSSTATPATS